MNKDMSTLLMVILILAAFGGVVALVMVFKPKNKFTNVSYKEEENINN
jgi:hypothetical protein